MIYSILHINKFLSEISDKYPYPLFCCNVTSYNIYTRQYIRNKIMREGKSMEYKNEIVQILKVVNDMKVIKIIHKYLLHAYAREMAKH